MLRAVIGLLGLASVATYVNAAGKPLAITLSPSAQTVIEGQPANLCLNKSGGNGKPSRVQITSSDGSFSATMIPGNCFSVPTLDDNIVNGTRQVVITGTATTGVTAEATITVEDNDVAPPPSGDLIGATPIADNFDASQGFEPTTYPGGIPPFGRLDDLGSFRFTCQPGPLLKDDPIVFPGQPGKSHLHLFIGNTGANANSTYDSLRSSGGGTCDNHGKTWAINRSSYWTPAMLDGVGNVVLPDYVQVYYKRFPIQGPGCVGPMAIGICTDLPNGLRFIFGYDMKTMTGGPTGEGTRDYWSMSYGCSQNDTNSAQIPDSALGRFHTIADLVKAGCPAGARLEVKLDAPQCWDGKNLDTPDHRSHMVYAPDGTDKGLGYVCPADHPYQIPLISYFWYYTTDDNFVAGKWLLSSDKMMNDAGMPVAAGTTLHMDYFEAWSPAAKAIWQKECINGPRSCSSGDMGNGTAMKDAGEPWGGWTNHRLVPAQ